MPCQGGKMNINNYLTYNGSEYTVNGKTYRNLEAQVLENMKNIESIDISGLETDVQNLGNQVDTNTNNISTNTNSINSINGEIVTINGDIDDLQSQYGSLDTFLKDTVTLDKDGWDANDEQTVTVTGLTDTDTVWMTPAMISGYEDYMIQVFGESGIYVISGSDDELTFKALHPENLPTEVDIYADIVFTHVVADVVVPDQTDLFFCTKDVTTYAEITSALQNDKLPVVFVDNAKRFFKYQMQYTNRYYFALVGPGAGCQQIYVDDYDTWSDIIAVAYLNSSQKVTTIDSDSTDYDIPTAKAVYDIVQTIATDYIFDATVSGTSVTLSNSKTAQDIVDAFDDGANEVYIRVAGSNGRYDKYRVCMAYNLESYPTYAIIYTDPISVSVTSTLNVQSIYFPGLTATGNVLTIKAGTI